MCNCLLFLKPQERHAKRLDLLKLEDLPTELCCKSFQYLSLEQKFEYPCQICSGEYPGTQLLNHQTEHLHISSPSPWFLSVIQLRTFILPFFDSEKQLSHNMSPAGIYRHSSVRDLEQQHWSACIHHTTFPFQ